jgi:hypothetical protein
LCDHCGSDRLELVSETAKPTWRELFWREDDRCPSWYADRQREDHRRYWTECNGADFYDWYLETQVESAKETGRVCSPPIQLFLPGLMNQSTRAESYLLDSY